MIFLLIHPFSSGIFHGYVSHNQMVYSATCTRKCLGKSHSPANSSMSRRDSPFEIPYSELRSCPCLRQTALFPLNLGQALDHLKWSGQFQNDARGLRKGLRKPVVFWKKKNDSKVMQNSGWSKMIQNHSKYKDDLGYRGTPILRPPI